MNPLTLTSKLLANFIRTFFTFDNFRYICSIEENAKEGTQLVFEGGLDKVEDPDKVFSWFIISR